MGRGKKNWKSADLILAALYRLLAWFSSGGNQCYVLANDLDQANDDLELAKKLVSINPILDNAVKVKQRVIERRDGKGIIEILPDRMSSAATAKPISSPPPWTQDQVCL